MLFVCILDFFPALISFIYKIIRDFPGGSDGKESACNAGELGSIPGLEDPLQKAMTIFSSVLAWKIPWTEETGRLHTVHGVLKIQTQLSD